MFASNLSRVCLIVTVFAATNHALNVPRQDDSRSATVDLARSNGDAQHIVAAIHNGIPPNNFEDYLAGHPPSTASVQTTIPAKYIDGLHLKNARGGQANLVAPSRGWLYGEEEYENRFRAVLSNYLTLRSYGGNFTLMVNNLFAQRTSSTPFPGKNGDWSAWDAFIERLCNDINSNQMGNGLDVEIWNEPDIQYSDQKLWRQVWGRGYHQLRQCLPRTVRIVGPGYAQPPPSDKWSAWLDFISKNNSVPDTYTWHHLQENTDPASTLPKFLSLLDKYNLPQRPIYINEYGAPKEQKPSFDAWFISRFERLNEFGFRGNWEKGSQTADLLANTLVKNGANYDPNGSWWVLSYYANMVGTRVETSASPDGGFDVFATSKGKGSGSTKILAGTHGSTAKSSIVVKGLSARSYKSSGSVTVNIIEFAWNGLGTAVTAPKSVKKIQIPIKNDSIVIDISPSSADVAYAVEF